MNVLMPYRCGVTNRHDKLGHITEAIADYNAALELQPRSAYVYYNRGIAEVMCSSRCICNKPYKVTTHPLRTRHASTALHRIGAVDMRRRSATSLLPSNYCHQVPTSTSTGATAGASRCVLVYRARQERVALT